MLQCVAVCVSVLQCVAACCNGDKRKGLREDGICCSVLQCVAVCCSVLQFVAMCCNIGKISEGTENERMCV